MRMRSIPAIFATLGFTFATLGYTSTVAQPETLPTAVEIASHLGIGWNLGNSLECPGGETEWNNPKVKPKIIRAVKNAGFQTIRIPCAWDSHADPETMIIDPKWMNRVQEVVDMALDNDLFVILNSHWDGGWLEEHPFYKYQEAVNTKQAAYWTQIANHFKAYDERLLFAGTNEVHADYNAPTTENETVLESYQQTFIDAVRETGGNNATRTLIVQTYNTNIRHGIDYYTIPQDTVPGRLMVEVHHYDPYQFTIMNPSDFPYWSADDRPEGAETWSTASDIRKLFSDLKAKWPDQGVPVIMGEYGAVSRAELRDQRQIQSRLDWLRFNTSLAINSGVIPVYWDNGAKKNGFALFDRKTGKTIDPQALKAIIDATEETND